MGGDDDFCVEEPDECEEDEEVADDKNEEEAEEDEEDGDECSEEEEEDDEEIEDESDDDGCDNDEEEEDDDAEEDDGVTESNHVVYPLNYGREPPSLIGLCVELAVAALLSSSPWYQRKLAEAAHERRLAELRETEVEGEDVCFQCETTNPPRCPKGHCRKCYKCSDCPSCGCGGGSICWCCTGECYQ